MSDSPEDTPGISATRRLERQAGRIFDLTGCTLTVIEGPDRGTTVTIEGRSVRIGKGPGCDLRLSDQSVSSQTTLEFAPVTRKLLTGPSSATRLEGLLGCSTAMRAAYGLIRQVAPTEATVVITGETGTGKEVAARTIHSLSPRNAGPFEVIDCGNVDRELLGSELFGHQKGAFTGAVSSHRGAFDRARGGTLLLDEIGELPADIQTRLLGVLQRREVRPLGAEAAHPIDTRVIAATHRDLEALVEKEAFREDLYFRLAVIIVEMPPLRERREDIPMLVQHFLKELSAPGADPPAVTEQAMDLMKALPWKGNVRELRNAIQRALVMAGGKPIEADHLGHPVRAGSVAARPGAPTLEEVECRTIREALERNQGNKMRTARELGIALATLKRKIKEYGLG
ncbi:MAG: sigma 54-dependent Fis family transcriptional regulator [Candidatus Riflebacteria bacterium]|nr:sigma 54-dependent Fis family transcriptional regulator [Candidatus Riflebacteria bacterium]